MKKLIALLSSVSLVATAGVAGIATVACGSSSSSNTDIPVSKDVVTAFNQYYLDLFGNYVYQVTKDNSNQTIKSTVTTDLAKLEGKTINDTTIKSVTLVAAYYAGVAINLDEATLSTITENDVQKNHLLTLNVSFTLANDTTKTYEAHGLRYQISFEKAFKAISDAYIADIKAILIPTTAANEASKITQTVIEDNGNKKLTTWVRRVLSQGIINPTESDDISETAYVGKDSSLANYGKPSSIEIISNDADFDTDTTLGEYIFEHSSSLVLPDFSAKLTFAATTGSDANKVLVLPISKGAETGTMQLDTTISDALTAVTEEWNHIQEYKSSFLFLSGLLPGTNAVLKTQLSGAVTNYLDYYKSINSLTANELEVDTANIVIRDSAGDPTTDTILVNDTNKYGIDIPFKILNSTLSGVTADTFTLTYKDVPVISQASYNLEIGNFIQFMENNAQKFTTFYTTALANPSALATAPLITAFQDRVERYIMANAPTGDKIEYLTLFNSLTSSNTTAPTITSTTAFDGNGFVYKLNLGTAASAIDNTDLTSLTNTESWAANTDFDVNVILGTEEAGDVDYDAYIDAVHAQLTTAGGLSTTLASSSLVVEGDSQNTLTYTTAAGATEVTLEQILTEFKTNLNVQAPDPDAVNTTNAICQFLQNIPTENWTFYMDSALTTPIADPIAKGSSGTPPYTTGSPIYIAATWTDPDGVKHTITPVEKEGGVLTPINIKLVITWTAA